MAHPNQQVVPFRLEVNAREGLLEGDCTEFRKRISRVDLYVTSHAVQEG
jgi:hypothetical protein